MSWNDFNTADKANEYDLIPNGTIAKVHMKIRPGGYDDPSQGWTGGLATRNDKTGAVYLNCEFTVLAGKYAKRKVFSLIGLHSPKGPDWANMGKTFIRSVLESARRIEPDDMTDKALAARKISGLGDLNGLEFVAKIGIEKGTGSYGDKNKIEVAITLGHKDYNAVMNEQTVASGPAPSAAAPAASGSVPAWAQG